MSIQNSQWKVEPSAKPERPNFMSLPGDLRVIRSYHLALNPRVQNIQANHFPYLYSQSRKKVVENPHTLGRVYAELVEDEGVRDALTYGPIDVVEEGRDDILFVSE